MPPFRVVSDFQPAGDQPGAIEQLSESIDAGNRMPDAARHHGLGQERHDRVDDRAGAAADAGDRAEQVVGRPARERVPRVLPGQPRRVLRLVLRLLPARGLHAVERHLHREGLVDQRRDRSAPPLGDIRAAHAPGRDRGRVGVVHLRPRRARRSTAISCSSCGRARSTINDRCCDSWSTCGTSATT